MKGGTLGSAQRGQDPSPSVSESALFGVCRFGTSSVATRLGILSLLTLPSLLCEWIGRILLSENSGPLGVLGSLDLESHARMVLISSSELWHSPAFDLCDISLGEVLGFAPT